MIHSLEFVWLTHLAADVPNTHVSGTLHRRLWQLGTAAGLEAGATRYERDTDHTERDLFAALARNDSGAWEDFIETCAGRLAALAERLTDDDALTEDVVLETCATLLRHRATVAHNPQPMAWVLLTLRRDAFAALRRTKRVRLEVDDAGTVTVADDELRRVLDEEERHYDWGRVVEVMEDACSTAEQEVILAVAHGHGTAKIAEHIGVSQDHVRVLKARAVGTLRAALDGAAS